MDPFWDGFGCGVLAAWVAVCALNITAYFAIKRWFGWSTRREFERERARRKIAADLRAEAAKWKLMGDEAPKDGQMHHRWLHYAAILEETARGLDKPK